VIMTSKANAFCSFSTHEACYTSLVPKPGT
jgi:hypothetical protein